jgi:hypothetical protein
MGRLLDRSQEDSRPNLLALEVRHERLDGSLHDVVGQHDHRAIAVNESLGQAKRLGDAARPLLIRVQQAVDAVLVTIAE